jgi:hypothetical protein
MLCNMPYAVWLHVGLVWFTGQNELAPLRQLRWFSATLFKGFSSFSRIMAA